MLSTTAHPRPVVATLGLADRLPAEPVIIDSSSIVAHSRAGFCITVDAWTERYTEKTRVGPDALAAIHAEIDGREIVETRPVAQVWRLADAGMAITRLSIVDPGLWSWAWASVDHGGSTWTVQITQGTGAPGALGAFSELYRRLLPSSPGETGRARATARRVADTVTAETAPERYAGARALVGGSGISYLGDVASGEQEDRGEPPLSWCILRNREVIARSAPPTPDAPLGRLARLRSAAAASLARDVSGRSRTNIKGSSLALASTSRTYRVRDAGEVDGGQWAMMHAPNKHLLRWSDRTGEKAVALASGALGPSQAAAIGQDLGAATTQVAERWMKLGLTHRQLQVAVLRDFGYRQEDIADRLGIARSTVANTVAAIRRKFEGD